MLPQTELGYRTSEDNEPEPWKYSHNLHIQSEHVTSLKSKVDFLFKTFNAIMKYKRNYKQTYYALFNVEGINKYFKCENHFGH